MSRFRPIDRKTAYLLPPSVDDWLPQDHLARFIAEAIEQLDLSTLTRAYAGRGSAAYHPEVLLGLLVYGYATATFSSRRIERATYDSVAFRYLAAGSHPDHDTLARFRRRFLDELGGIFLQVLELASEMKLLTLGTVSLDGTKLHANASRHSALSYGHIGKLETQLKAEVQDLLAQAEAADQADLPDGVNLPEEIKRREDRLTVMADARAKIEARAQVRFKAEQAAYEEKLAQRAARTAQTGKKPTGKPPQAPSASPRPEDQINLTDQDSRIMKVAGGGFDQCYNAQAAVDAASMLVVVPAMTQAANDKQQIEPVLERIKALPTSLGRVETLLADAGYCSANNLAACEAAGIDPHIAVAKEDHHPDWRARFAEPEPLTADATPMQKMAHKLKTKLGRMLYALRKQTVEPVFGIIKSVMGFRQFMLRGLAKVTGEWTLACLAWNLKRMAVLRQKSVSCL
jgi:transposase